MNFRLMMDYNDSKCIPSYLKTIKDLSKIKYNFMICNKTAAHAILWEKMSSMVKSCPKPCNTNGFNGEVKKYAWGDGEVPVLTLFFSSNEIIVQEEYLLYNLHDFIGIVGGNLGLFIGLSLFELVKMIFSVITYYFKK